MNLREIRLESGLKAKKVANELGISREQLYHLENGKYRIKEKYIDILCEVYQVRKEDVLNAINQRWILMLKREIEFWKKYGEYFYNNKKENKKQKKSN